MGFSFDWLEEGLELSAKPQSANDITSSGFQGVLNVHDFADRLLKFDWRLSS